ncbi:MAG: response regulator [Bryobacteraceae bacterium]|jgi:CheY-like chemotaxis protein
MDIDDSLNTAVVVGDDRGAVMQEVSSTLEKVGFVVVTAPNGQAALDLCREQHRPVDLAVIDTAAAGIRPLEVEEQLHEMSPSVRVLFLSDDNAEMIPKSLGQTRQSLRQPFRRCQFLGQVLDMMAQPRAASA